MNYRFKKKISYFFNARHRKGHGIHSPFLFRLLTEVIENKGNFTAYPLLKAAEENVGNMLRILDADTYHQLYDTAEGCNSYTVKKLHLLPDNFNRLLFRLVNDFRPQSLAFYGSTFGVTLLALALADRRTVLEAQVENSHYRSFCRRLVEVYEVENIRLNARGSVSPADFVVVQNPLDPDYIQSVLSKILRENEFSGVVVLCGIHTSPEMEQLWFKYQKSPLVRISLDLFEIGIYICRTGLQKENFVLRF